jgi:hypothetical protein
MKTCITALLLVIAFCVGCGGYDNVSRSKKLRDLSAAEREELCIERTNGHPSRVITCENGSTVTLRSSPAQCAADSLTSIPQSCEATVSDAIACQDALDLLTDTQLCSPDFLPAACAKFASCGSE